MSTGRERRRASRREAKRPLQAHLALEAEVLTLSPRGMMVGLPFAPELGSRHFFSLRVNNRPLDVLGIVRNVAPRDEEASVYHVGVEFTDLAAPAAALLAQFVAKKLKSP
jgi:hypothetical protein